MGSRRACTGLLSFECNYLSKLPYGIYFYVMSYSNVEKNETACLNDSDLVFTRVTAKVKILQKIIVKVLLIFSVPLYNMKKQ
jgi:hypothetical protein